MEKNTQEDERDSKSEESHVRIGELNLALLHQNVQDLHGYRMICGSDENETCSEGFL